MNNRLKEIRKSARMTQPEFGKAIGATRDMIATYESGRVTPSDATIELICIKFHISRHWLMTGEGPKDDIDPDDDIILKIIRTYHNLPERFKDQVKILVSMDPEWWIILDEAFNKWEEKKADDL